MGLDDLKKMATDALNSDKGEQLSDQVLDKAAEAANQATGDKFEGQVNAAREAADKALGTE